MITLWNGTESGTILVIAVLLQPKNNLPTKNIFTCDSGCTYDWDISINEQEGKNDHYIVELKNIGFRFAYVYLVWYFNKNIKRGRNQTI